MDRRLVQLCERRGEKAGNGVRNNEIEIPFISLTAL